MIRSISAIILILIILIMSWPALRNPRSHGFYRFFGFSATIVLLLLNLPYWIDQAFSPRQIISWLLLLISLVFVLWGTFQLKRAGGYASREGSPETFAFEETQKLVTTGLYRYIRHPMYSSLLFLTLGAFLKHISLAGILLVVVATLAYILTARMEERENIEFFGESYRQYIQQSKAFIPFLF